MNQKIDSDRLSGFCLKSVFQYHKVIVYFLMIKK